jgi:hypothetical protein
VAAFQTGKRKQPPKEETPVQVYQDPQGADGFMLLRYENRIVTGRMTTAESRAVSWRRMRLLFIGLGVITALVVAGLVIIQAGRIQHLKEDRIQAEASRSWPQVQGVVTASEIANTRISKGKSSVAGYRADIEYTYAVGGTEFVGWALYFGYRESTERDRALALVDRFPRGREIPVWYNPARPETAVLEPGHEEDAQEHLTKAWTALMTSGLIGGLMVVILLVAVFVSRSRWNRAMASVNAAGLP